MGDGSWTQQLHTMIEKAEAGEEEDDKSPSTPKLPTVYLDGPYGSLSVNVETYDSLVLVAGGIGITPFASLAGYITNYKTMGRFGKLSRLRIVWMTKYNSQLAVFDDVLGQTYVGHRQPAHPPSSTTYPPPATHSPPPADYPPPTAHSPPTTDQVIA